MEPIQRETDADSEPLYSNEEEARTSQKTEGNRLNVNDSEKGVSKLARSKEMEPGVYHESVYMFEAEQVVEEEACEKRSKL